MVAVIEAAVGVVVDKASLRRARGQVDDFAEKSNSRLGRLGSAAKAAALPIAAIGTAAVGAGVALVSNFIEGATEIDNLSKRAGISAESLQVWGRVAAASGGNAEDITDAIREMNLRLAEAATLGSGPAVDALNLVGLSLEDLQNLKPEEQFALIRDRLSEIEDPALRTFAAEELLGGASERLAEFTALSADAFDEQAKAARDAGGIMSNETVASATEAGKQFNELKTRILGVVNDAIGKLIPILLKAVDYFRTEVVPVLKEQLEPAFKALQEVIQTAVIPIIKTLLTVVKNNIGPIKLIVGGVLDFITSQFKLAFDIAKAIVKIGVSLIRGDFSGAAEGIKDILRALFTFMKTRVKAVVKIVTGIFKLFGVDVGNVFIRMQNAGAKLVNNIAGFFKRLPGRLKGAINSVIGYLEAIPNAFVGAINSIIRAWNRFSIRTNPVKILGRTVIPSISWETPNVATFKNARLPRLQEGGVVTRDTVARIGEGGEPEAIVPLSRADQFGFGGGGDRITNLYFTTYGNIEIDNFEFRVLEAIKQLGNQDQINIRTTFVT